MNNLVDNGARQMRTAAVAELKRHAAGRRRARITMESSLRCAPYGAFFTTTPMLTMVSPFFIEGSAPT